MDWEGSGKVSVVLAVAVTGEVVYLQGLSQAPTQSFCLRPDRFHHSGRLEAIGAEAVHITYARQPIIFTSV